LTLTLTVGIRRPKNQAGWVVGIGAIAVDDNVIGGVQVHVQVDVKVNVG